MTETDKPIFSDDDDDPEDSFFVETETLFDWKKKGFDFKEKLTLKNDTLEAEAYAESRKKQSRPDFLNKKKNFVQNFNKIRSKIRDIYEEDEEEDDEIILPQKSFGNIKMKQDEDNSLLNALTDDEKNMLRQKSTIENVKMQQDAGKMEALHMANNLAKEAGLQGLSRKAVSLGMQKATFDPEKTQIKVVKKEISEKLGIKGKLEEGKLIQAARGIKKVEQLGGKKATKNLDMRDVVKAGEGKLDEIKLAELILEKSGQDVKKRKQNLQKSKENIELKNFKNTDKEKAKDKNPFRKKNTELSR